MRWIVLLKRFWPKRSHKDVLRQWKHLHWKWWLTPSRLVESNNRILAFVESMLPSCDNCWQGWGRRGSVQDADKQGTRHFSFECSVCGVYKLCGFRPETLAGGILSGLSGFRSKTVPRTQVAVYV